MAKITPQILQAQVMHQRLRPKINQFQYRTYYLAIPLDALQDTALTDELAVNRFAATSFYPRDHGYRDGGDLRQWAADMHASQHLPPPHNITLICMPRVFGYVFNPVSFWLCRAADHSLRSIICEVNNTFGETHSYLCSHADGRAIGAGDWMRAEKFFHVSPFLKREGSYLFHFNIDAHQCHITINHHNPSGEKILLTSLYGKFSPLDRQALRRALCQNPLLTFRVISLIHYQALKLFIKGIGYITKPVPVADKISGANTSARKSGGR